MAMGLHDAFALIEQFGHTVLTEEERYEVRQADQMYGCVFRRGMMTQKMIDAMLEYGRRCLLHKAKTDNQARQVAEVQARAPKRR